MDKLQKILLQKESDLQTLTKKLKAATVHVPEGTLRISCCKNVVQYYHCTTDGNERRKHYIRKKDRLLAVQLAQKEYDLQALEEAEKNLKSIQRLLKTYNPDRLEQLYKNLNCEKRKLIIPHRITDDEYAESWLQKEYSGKTFSEGTAEIYTERGERVRSKSEKIIADMLNKRGIPYKYECPLQLNGIGIIYPDFTILDKRERKEIYLEHLGMMDNAEYCENALHRIDYYIKNGIMLGDRLLITYETAKHPLNTSIVDRVIQSVNAK